MADNPASITRRDFLNGIPIAVGGAVAAGLSPEYIAAAFADGPAPQDAPGYYPPALTGLRGSHPGAYEAAHRLRDGDFWSQAGNLKQTSEDYDLIVVGGGISGLAAAHFYRAKHQDARILILDNHDDFGGHAKRNEFSLDGRIELINGGTLLIDSPRPYSAVADGLLKTLGIDPVALTQKCSHSDFYPSLGLNRSIFLDQETFGADKLIAVPPGASWAQLLADTPLSPKVRSDIVRIQQAAIDYMPGLTSAEKKTRLAAMSYRDYLLNVVKADPGVIPFYQTRTHGEWGVGIDAVSALDVWAFEFPGFSGLHLEQGSAPHTGYTANGYADNGGSYTFHFPDGNASAASGARSDSRLRAGQQRRGRRHGADRLRAARPASVAGAHPARQHGGACAQCRRSGFVERRRDRLFSRRRRVHGARASLCARLLEHDDSVSVSGIAATAD
jgi:spermidine dehydrogenase